MCGLLKLFLGQKRLSYVDTYTRLFSNVQRRKARHLPAWNENWKRVDLKRIFDKQIYVKFSRLKLLI